jgi:flagellar transcriptional activator FlhC
MLDGAEAVLTLTRAWTMLRYFDSRLLSFAACRQCRGNFIVDALDLNDDFVCGLCAPPSRAGKTRKAASASQDLQYRPVPLAS